MRLLMLSVLVVLMAMSATAQEEQPVGAPVTEPGLKGRTDILWFEGFETSDWQSHWMEVSEGATLADDPSVAFAGRKALAVRSTKGGHGSVGGSVYFPEGHDVLHVRYYLYFPGSFSWGEGRYAHLKLFGLEGLPPGEKWKSTPAGTRPTGTDKFSSRICARPKTGELEFYYYHPDQRGGYGDHRAFTVALQRGRWTCLETMLKVNSLGEKDGEVALWLDGKEVGRVTGLRFRDVGSLTLHKARFDNYWGGAGDENTAPVDQVHYMDNLVVATEYIGPATGVERQAP
jgi:hypothetical protein